MLHAVKIHFHAIFAVFGQKRVISAQLFQKAAIARVTAVGGNDRIMRALFGTTAGKANFMDMV